MTQRLNYSLLAIGILLLAVFIGWLGIRPAVGSVSVSNDYNATTTAPSNVYGAQNAQTSLIRTGYGSFGSVIVTGANTGVMNFWDATTTNVNLRTGQVATSSLRLLASLPASVAAGTYTFDVLFTTGLIYDVFGGTIATTTITYR